MGYFSKQFYKGISLFIKTGILILSVLYITHKINSSNLLEHFYNAHFYWSFFLVALSLVFINWGIEAYKWQFLIQRIEKLSFAKAYQSVLSGVTIGVFTPNRVGEFAGRVFYLESDNKVQASLISFVGSAFQLLVTILIGLISAVCIAFQINAVKLTIVDLFTSVYFLIGFSLFALLIIVLFLFRKKIHEKYKKHVDVLYSYSYKELLKVFYLSLFRYLVFTIQYYLILKCMNLDLSFSLSFHLISLTFLVSSIIPTVAYTEMIVRGASAVYFFSFYVPDTSLVLAASLIVWLINLALPSCIGAFFIWRLKFFVSK